MFDPIAKLEKRRIYRIFISFLVSFVLLNLITVLVLPTYKNTLRASEILLDDNVCNFALEDFQDIENSIRKDKNSKIFFLGDSVGYGIGVLQESASISGYLREIFQEYSVYNLSTCGSKPLDYYLWISYLKDIDPDYENIFIIQYNYKWFNADSGLLEDRISQKLILNILDNYLNEEINEVLDFRPTLFEKLHHNINKLIPVSANKTKLFASIFNEKSKEDFIEHFFYGKPLRNNFEYKSRNWREKDEMKTFNCKISYGANEWNPDKNFNYYIYLKTLNEIKNKGINAFVFLPAYNYELTKKCQTEIFNKNIERFKEEAKTLNIQNAAFISEIDESYFLDDMHLSSEGNKLLAELIAKELNKQQ